MNPPFASYSMEHNISNAYNDEDLPDLRPKQIQVTLNRPNDHWTTTTESTTEEIMTASDLEHAAQLFDNTDVEQLTDPTEDTQDIDTEEELGNQEVIISQQVQVDTNETNAEDELIEDNRRERRFQYRTFSWMNVTAILRFPLNNSNIEFCRIYNDSIVDIEN